MTAELVNLGGTANKVTRVLDLLNEKRGKIEQILVVWKEEDTKMLFEHSDLSSLLFLGMLKLIGDDISEQKREDET